MIDSSHFSLEKDGGKELLIKACKDATEEVLIICPFIKHAAIVRLLPKIEPAKLRVLTRLDLEDCIAGVHDLKALTEIIQSGGRVRGVKDLHAKTYIFDKSVALITSLNLTVKALTRNHELGFSVRDPAHINMCHETFNHYWQKAGPDVSLDTIALWQADIVQAKGERDAPPSHPRLGDHGQEVTPQDRHKKRSTQSATQRPIANRAHLKFLGKGNNRADIDYRTIDEVERSGCNWAVGYPKNDDNPRRPRQPKDGDWMYFARLVRDGNVNDIRIFGRGKALEHVEGRDEATKKEIELLGWKESWGFYVRITEPEIFNGAMKDGISLAEIHRLFEAETYASTSQNASRKSGNEDPRKSIRQKAGIELASDAATWLEIEFDRKAKINGVLGAAALERSNCKTRPELRQVTPSKDTFNDI